MSTEPDRRNENVKRIVLPSGRTIEVISFSEVADELTGRYPAGADYAPPEGLHICPDCGSRLVYPTEWEEAGHEAWHVWLRCPNCDWERDGVFRQHLLDEFDEELDRGMEELAADLARLTRANMAEEIDRFVAALEADAILPMDF
ncbi:MAG: hypothetical protein IRZ21_06790 [Thermoleophilaceae bacterium]|nr:hypothetical protein [Thermoleophilaceae bacterium]